MRGTTTRWPACQDASTGVSIRGVALKRRRRWAIAAWSVGLLTVGAWQISGGNGLYWVGFTAAFIGGYLLLMRLSDRRERP